MYLQIELKNNDSTTIQLQNIGYSIIKYITIEIGGKQIDRHTGEWLYIWNEQTTPNRKKDGLNKMVGKNVFLSPNESVLLFIPLQFWFCRDYGLSLPLISLQYHDVKINIELNQYIFDIHGNNINNSVQLIDFQLIIDYIFLDIEERTNFAERKHEYIIEQVQHNGSEYIELRPPNENGIQEPVTYNHSFNLHMKHPMKEIIWVVKQSDKNFIFLEHDEATIFLNGHMRQETRKGEYYSLVQPYQYHSNIPHNATSNNSIHVFSFSLSPELLQPTGTCNFSKINKAQLHIKTRVEDQIKVVNIYGFSYNVLRIFSGMGGIVF